MFFLAVLLVVLLSSFWLFGLAELVHEEDASYLVLILWRISVVVRWKR